MSTSPNKTKMLLSMSRNKACLAFAAALVVALSRYCFNKSHDRIADNGGSIRRRLQEDVSVNNVASITLIGERHSGTNWITDHLRECFGDELKVRVGFILCKSEMKISMSLILCYWLLLKRSWYPTHASSIGFNTILK